MKIDINIEDKAYKPFEKIDIQVVFENTSSNSIIIPRCLSYIPSFNGSSKEGTSAKESIERYNSENTILPNETIKYSFRQAIELCFIPNKNDLVFFDFKINIGGNDFGKEFSKKLQIDFTNFTRIKAKNKELSNYYKSGDKVFYYSTYSRAYEEAITLLKGTIDDYEVLNENYIINSQNVFNDGRLVRGVSSKGFKVYNKLFSGNENVILTRYGKAKVQNPKTFKVLDSGLEPSLFSSEIDGYRCGYAVDNEFAYYFDESTSTQHAIRIIGCKNPSKLVSLGFGFAKDDKSVFLEGKKIAKAKSDTFKILNRNYATDGKHLFSHRDVVDNADMETFEILPTRSYRKFPDPILNSSWAKDKNHYYRWAHIKEKSEYEKYMEE